MSIPLSSITAMFSFTKVETGEPSISCQSASDCTKLRLKFQKFTDRRTPISGKGDTHSPDPFPFGQLDDPPDSFILPLKQTADVVPLLKSVNVFRQTALLTDFCRSVTLLWLS